MKAHDASVCQFPSKADLRWIDKFIRNIRPHVYVRERDRLLILMPNQAYHLNDTGFLLLKAALSGMPIVRIVDNMLPRQHHSPQVFRDVHEFFCDLRALVMGCLFEGVGRHGVEQIPFQQKANLLPVLSEIAVTYRCNLSCKFCYAGCTCTSMPTCGEMSADEVKSVLLKIRFQAEVPSVSFTGGEPTLRSDLCDLIAYATSIGLRVNLITNGTTITPSLAARFSKAGLRSAQVSVEGPTAELHDMLTRQNGAFQKALDGIRHLQAHGIYVHTNTTINALNAAYVEGMVDLATSLGLPRLSMNMVMPCGTAGTGEIAIRYSHIGDIVQRVKRKARRSGIEFMWYSPTPCCMFNPIAAGLGSKACAACDGLLSVAANGDVLPCSSLMDPVGNLVSQDFDDIWNSERARFYRERLHAPEACRACEQFDICSGACPIYWDAFGCDELTVATCERVNYVGPGKA